MHRAPVAPAPPSIPNTATASPRKSPETARPAQSPLESPLSAPYHSAALSPQNARRRAAQSALLAPPGQDPCPSPQPPRRGAAAPLAPTSDSPPCSQSPLRAYRKL